MFEMGENYIKFILKFEKRDEFLMSLFLFDHILYDFSCCY